MGQAKVRKSLPPLISVLIPVRGRPKETERLVASLVALSEHDTRIEIILAIDDDDLEASPCIPGSLIYRLGATYRIWPRPATLGIKLNMLAEQAKGDILWFLPNDHIVETEGWPGIIRAEVARLTNGVGVLYPHDELHPSHTSYPIITRPMYKALGYFMPRYFPYWFVDTWWDEIGEITGIKAEIPVTVSAPEGRGRSHGLTDLEFWVNVFNETRPIRVSDALKLCQIIDGVGDGAPLGPKGREVIPTLKQRVEFCASRTSHLSDPGFIAHWEGNAASAPSPAYAEVKAEAEKILAQIKAQTPKQVRVAICIPSGRDWDAGTALDVAGLMAHSALRGVACDIIGVQCSMISKGRNDLVQLALEAKADYLLWVDSDMRFNPDTLLRLLKHDKDVVGCLYNKRVPPYETLGKLAGEPPEPGTVMHGLHEALLIPGGMLLVKADVYRKIKWPAYYECYRWPGKDGLEALKGLLRDYFSTSPPEDVLDSLEGSPLGEWIKDNYAVGHAGEPILYMSEDLAFCRKARRHGYRLWVDMDLTYTIKHMGQLEVTCLPPEQEAA